LPPPRAGDRVAAGGEGVRAARAFSAAQTAGREWWCFWGGGLGRPRLQQRVSRHSRIRAGGEDARALRMQVEP
jgi:hypothetical protein